MLPLRGIIFQIWHGILKDPEAVVTGTGHYLTYQGKQCLSGWEGFWINRSNDGVFPKIDDSGNVGNKGLCRAEQNKFIKKVVGIEPGTLGLFLWHILC